MPASLPSWERGLKYLLAFSLSVPVSVAPLVGAWIEICSGLTIGLKYTVAPLLGAWIEITRNFVGMSGECGNTNN